MGKWEISKGHSDTSYRTAEPPAEVSAAWPNHNMLQSLAQRIKTNINKMGAHPFWSNPPEGSAIPSCHAYIWAPHQSNCEKSIAPFCCC